jgi:drug/metabolite transporter (DMT)-like permease
VTVRPVFADPARRHKAMRRLTFATIFWAMSFPTMKALVLAQHQLLPDAGSWFLTSLGVFYRFSCAGFLLLILIARQLHTISRRELEQGLVLAGFGGLGILFQMDGLSYTSASTSAFLTQSYCIFIPLWFALLTRRLPALKPGICIALVVAGVWVLAGLDIHDLKLGRGELETLIGSLLFTGQIITLENHRYTGNRPLPLSTVMFLTMAILCLPFVWATAPGAAACLHAFASPAAASFLTVLVIFCTLGGYLLMNHWQPFVSSTEAGLIYCLEPVLASLLALFIPYWLSRWAAIDYPNEHLTSQLLLGGGLITAANILLQSPWLEARSRLPIVEPG